MSADNGVYILKTKADDVSVAPFEYRVTEASGIENIYWDDEEGDYRKDRKFTPEIAFEYFQRAPVFSKEREALERAGAEADNCEVLEYGISVLDHGDQVFETFSPEEMNAFEMKVEEFMEERRRKRQIEIEENLAARTLTLRGQPDVTVFGRVEFASPDWDGDKPETQKMLTGSFKGRVHAMLLDDTEVIVDNEFTPVRRV